MGSRGVVVGSPFLISFDTTLRVWSRGNDDSPSEGDDKWLTRVKREPYLLHVKDTLVDFEKEQANAATR